MRKQALVAAAVAALAGATQAQVVIFSDDFQAAPPGENATPPGWGISDGTVDTLGPGYFPDLCLRTSNRCIDLDGTSSNAGELTRSVSLTGGLLYQLSFDLAGSQRGSTEIVDVAFGGTTGVFTRNSLDPFSNGSLSFTPASSASYQIFFENRGGDNIGALLDNVGVTAVPEPSVLALVQLIPIQV